MYITVFQLSYEASTAHYYTEYESFYKYNIYSIKRMGRLLKGAFIEEGVFSFDKTFHFFRC